MGNQVDRAEAIKAMGIVFRFAGILVDGEDPRRAIERIESDPDERMGLFALACPMPADLRNVRFEEDDGEDEEDDDQWP